MKKNIITGTATVNVLLNNGNSILKEVGYVGKFNERKIVKKAIADLEEVCKAKVVRESVREELNTYEMSEETFIANATIVIDYGQYELELD